jgi:transketolase
MRGAFVKTLEELAAQDERIVLLTADLGFTVLEPFAQAFPERFLNVGVAEQNMAGMATGLAEAGFIPFIYSIGTFASLRAYEFIRNGAVMQHLPVRIVGIGAGLEYSTAGFSHNSLEDIALMRAQPNLRVIAPADGAQTRQALLQTWNLPGPIYYRVGKNDKLSVPGLEGHFELGAPVVLGQGRDILLFTTGSIAAEVVALAEVLAQRDNIHATIAILASLNPAPDVGDLLKNFRYALSIEDHYIQGGIGSIIAEAIAEGDYVCRLLRCGVNVAPDGLTGSLDYLRQHYGLGQADLRAKILKHLGKAK